MLTHGSGRGQERGSVRLMTLLIRIAIGAYKLRSKSLLLWAVN